MQTFARSKRNDKKRMMGGRNAEEEEEGGMVGKIIRRCTTCQWQLLQFS